MPLLWGLAGGVAAGAATVLLARAGLSAPWRVLVALFPLLPTFGYIWSVVRMLRQVDELQRRIQLEAIGFAFAATVIVAMAVDLLTQARIVPAVHWGWCGLWCVMALLWALGHVIAYRRYR